MNAFGSSATVVQSTEISTIPDTSHTSECESNCCACNVATNVASSSGTRTRHFHIGGDIDIEETLFTELNGNSSEESAGHSMKASACAVTNNNGEGSAPGGECIILCPNGTTSN